MADAERYTEEYIPILSDSFDVLTRIKQIDDSYFVLYNRKTNRFEVHSSNQAGNTFCLTLPYDYFDVRSLYYVRKYRHERAKEIFAEMEKENETLEKQHKKQQEEQMHLRFEEALRKA